MEGLTLFFIGVFYILLAIMTKPISEEYVNSYADRNMYISISARDYLSRYKTNIVRICSVMFPFFYCFIYGSLFAKKFYSILIENKDENRIASWLF